MDKIKKLSVCESFPSIQGEGKTMGVPSVFLRLAGCNLMCGGKGTEKDGKLHNGATWRCDTIEVWRKGKPFTPEELVEKLNKDFGFLNCLRKGYHLIITGGEPMMQQKSIMEFLLYLEFKYNLIPYVEIETNGTIGILPEFMKGINLQFNISPKIKNSGVEFSDRQLLSQYCYIINSQFKFVVGSKDDLYEVIDVIQKNKIALNKVWLMPAASDQEELNRVQESIINEALKLGCNYSHRLHIAIYNKKTGV